MSFVSGEGADGFNSSHWAATRLLFAWRGGVRGARRVQNAVRGRDVLTQTGSPVAISRDGFGMSSTAASEYWTGVVRQPSSFGGDLTMLWRGVLLGDGGTGNYGCMGGQLANNGSGNPYNVFAMHRTPSAPNSLTVISNNVGTYTISTTDVGLSNYYNIPLCIAVSNVAGSASIIISMASPARGFISQTSTSMNLASSNPRGTGSTDQFIIGENQGAGRFPNAVCTGFAMWDIAMNAAQLRDITLRPGHIFAPIPDIMSAALMSAGGGAPGPTTQSGSGYNRFRRPFGNPFHRPF